MAQQYHVIDDLRGGRNGADPPLTLPANQTVDAVNMEWYHSRIGGKRAGGTAIGLTFSVGGPFGWVWSMFRHVPGTNDGAAELWAVDADYQICRLAGGTTWTEATLKDAISTDGAWKVAAASLQGKLFFAYPSAQDRLHVWDGSTVRRTGIYQGTNAPTVANTGAGAYAAVLRYYRVRFIEVVGGVVTRRSEATPSVSFTPSGTGTAARVTQPSVPGEGETHWEVEVSLDNVTFYVLAGTGGQAASIAIGTTTYDDSLATTLYNTGAAAKATGTFTLQKSYKFLAADQSRLLGFGAWTSTNKQNRVEFSAIFGSLDVGDTERVDTTAGYYVDLDESDSGLATGIIGPVWGNFYAFKEQQVWELSPTGDPYRPYRTVCLSKAIGNVDARALAVGEDSQGNPALYFLSKQGPYRYGVRGFEYIGREIEDITLGVSQGWNPSPTTINLSATIRIAHSVYYPKKRQWWLWVSIGSNDYPATLLVYSVDFSAWSQYTNQAGSSTNLDFALCACLFSNTVAATMSRDLKPFISVPAASPTILKMDTGTTDNGNAFKAYLTTKPMELGGPMNFFTTGDAMLTAQVLSGATLTVDVFPDFRNPTQAAIKTGTTLLTQDGSDINLRWRKRAENTAIGHVQAVAYRIGDSAVVDSGSWVIDRLMIPVTTQEVQTA